MYATEDSEVVILCSESVATRIYKVLNRDGISCSLPKRIVFDDEEGTIEHTDFEVIAALTEEEANRRIDELVAGLSWDEQWPRH